MYHTLKYYRLFSVPANNKQCFRHTKLDIFLPRFIFLTLHICLCTSFFLNCSFLLFSNQNLKIPGKFYTPLSNTNVLGEKDKLFSALSQITPLIMNEVMLLQYTIAEEAEQGARTSESNLHSGSHGVGPVILKLRSTSPAITDNLSLIRNLPGEIMYKYNECNITQYQNQAGRHKKQKLKASIIHEEKHKNSKALKYLHIIFFFCIGPCGLFNIRKHKCCAPP